MFRINHNFSLNSCLSIVLGWLLKQNGVRSRDRELA